MTGREIVIQDRGIKKKTTMRELYPFTKIMYKKFYTFFEHFNKNQLTNAQHKMWNVCHAFNVTDEVKETLKVISFEGGVNTWIFQ